MAQVRARIRGHGEDSIYFDAAKNRYVRAVSLGFDGKGVGVRRKVTGMAKKEIRDKLKELHAELDAGLRAPADYTVQAALDDWLAEGLSGRSARTAQLYRDGVSPLAEKLGCLWRTSPPDTRFPMSRRGWSPGTTGQRD